MAAPEKALEPVELFFSYSHKDEKPRDKLATHLSTLKSQSVIREWHDRKIGAGTERTAQIDEHLDAADIILLLVSADFLASDYCRNTEMKRALERHEKGEARVIPVILRPCDWHGELFGDLQPVPLDGKPITSRHWHSQDEAFMNVAQGIRRAVEELRSSSVRRPSSDRTKEPRQASPPPNNLPHQLTSFMGREKEIAEVKTLLNEHRLVTLTGAGGVGKTRLALEVGAQLLDSFPDGVWFVELAPLSDPALVPQAVAQVLGLREETGRTLDQTLRDHLRPKSLLLLLDNTEHLLDSSARLADTLLRACPHLKVLATSRQALGIMGETLWRVPSLSAPDPSKLPSVEEIGKYEAVRLFTERAIAVSPDFAITESNALALAQVCQRLDGIPLAIELAAARTKAMPVEEIAQALDDQFNLFTSGNRAADPRQQTLRALIDWSYDLLNEKEKVLLRRLSVFVGGWTRAAAEGVCAGEDIQQSDVRDLLTGLVDKSLVIYDKPSPERSQQASGQARYHLLETIRQYAHERLKENGDLERVRDCHLLWFVSVVEEAEPKLVGAEQATWLTRLEMEHDNLRAALGWCQQETSEQEQFRIEAGLRLCGALWRFWYVHGDLSEGRKWIQRMLERAHLLPRLLEGVEVAKEVKAKALNGAGNLAYRQSDDSAAQALLEEALALWRDVGDKKDLAMSLDNLGLVKENQGDYAEARTLHEESLRLRREIGDDKGIAASLNNLGSVAYRQGDDSSARALLKEALALRRGVGDKAGIATSLNNLGNVFERQGDYAEAWVLQEEALVLRREIRYSGAIAESLEAFASLAITRAQFEKAARLYGAANVLRNTIGAPLPPFEQEKHDGNVASARAALGEEAFAAAWAEGRSMTMEQAVEYALGQGEKEDQTYP